MVGVEYKGPTKMSYGTWAVTLYIVQCIMQFSRWTKFHILSLSSLNLGLVVDTKSMLTIRSCCSLMFPLALFTLLTLTEVTGGRALAIFGAFLVFLFGCNEKSILPSIASDGVTMCRCGVNCKSFPINEKRLVVYNVFCLAKGDGTTTTTIQIRDWQLEQIDRWY